MEIVRFAPQDLFALSLQNAQRGMQDIVCGEGYGQSLAAAGPAFTAKSRGEIIACIGTIPQWQGYHRAWALLSGDAGRCMVSLTRGVQRWLRFHNPGRVDTAVKCDFTPAIRWAEMLGFTSEGVMRKYRDGEDFYLYAQVV